jgi:hypothetical protein
MQTAVGSQWIETQGISGQRWCGRWRISLAGLLIALCCEKHLPHATWGNAGFGGDGSTHIFQWASPCACRWVLSLHPLSPKVQVERT